MLKEDEGMISVARRTISNLRFADDVDGLVGVRQELAHLVEGIVKTSTTYLTRHSTSGNKKGNAKEKMGGVVSPRLQLSAAAVVHLGLRPWWFRDTGRHNR